MPYTIVEEGGEYCVYKMGEDGKPIGDNLGCSPTAEQAGAHIGAIEHGESGKALDADALVYHGGEVKALGDGRIGGYLVRFTSPDSPDLSGEYFDADTDYGDADKSAVYYEHGMDPVIGKRRLATGTMRKDNVGVWIETQLARRDEYERFIYQQVEAGKAGWSSGTAGHLMDRAPMGKAVHITAWPLGLDASITLTPAEPRNVAVPLKSLTVVPLTVPKAGPAPAGRGATTKKVSWEVKMDVPFVIVQDGPEATPFCVYPANGEGAAEGETLGCFDSPETAQSKLAELLAAAVPVAGNQEETMTTEESKALRTELGALRGQVEQLTKALQGPSSAGYRISERGDTGGPFKSVGELLQTVARDPNADSLRNVRSEFGYDMVKAVGPRMLWSGRNVKDTPTGLGETYPTAAGVLVGQQEMPGLIARMYEVGTLIGRITMMPVGEGKNGATWLAEKETSRANGSRRGGIRAYWGAEASSTTSSHPEFRKMSMILDKVEAVMYVTDEQLEDASMLGGWASTYVPEELKFVAEDALINGLGSGMPQGILNSPALVTQAKQSTQAADTIVAENISKMWARLWVPSRSNAIWLYNQEAEPQFDALAYAVGTGGSLVYLGANGIRGDAGSVTLKGRPAYACEYSAGLGDVGDILLVDLSQILGIQKGGIKEQSSIHVRFLQGETVFKFTWRLNFMSMWEAPLTPYKQTGTHTVSPFVALAAR